MSLFRLFGLSYKELIRYRGLTLFMILNLTVGLFGFFLLQIFQQSLQIQSSEKSQVVLGGDLAITARRSFTADEIIKWESEFTFKKRSHQFSSFSMLRSTKDPKLVNVTVFDDEFPLYGQFKISTKQLFSSEKPYIWLDPEVKNQLDLKEGDTVDIGEMKFILAGVILEDPSKLFQGMGFAPRVYIHIKYLDKTALIRRGSTFTETWYYKLSPNQNSKRIKIKLSSGISDPFINIRSAQDQSDTANANRVLQYFTDYLGLVALVALGLCFLCSSYLLQWVFASKKKTIAIYKTLGLSDTKIIYIYLFQNLIVSILGCVFAVLLAVGTIPVLQQVLISKFNLSLILTISAKSLTTTGLIAIAGPLFIIVPQISQIINLRPLLLLQNIEVKNFKRKTSLLIWLILLIISFWVLAVSQSHSYKVASIFTLSAVSMILLFRLMNRLILFVLEKLSTYFDWSIRYAIKGLTRKPAAAGLVFITISLSTLVLSLLPHIKSSIIYEVRPEQSRHMPALFMFDIQPEQRENLNKLAANILQQKLKFSPLVRSRILKVNDVNYERNLNFDEIQTREAEEEARFRNRGINLTYRGNLQDSEQVVEGVFTGSFVSGSNEALPKISLEKKYAERMGLSLGDIVTFDVQGVEVKAQVGSYRRVRWTSFQPNFFILFPNGVIEDAPQMFLTSVVQPQSPDSQFKINDFQRQASNQFKNVSIIDVSRTVENSLKYIDQMSLGLEFMAWLAVLLGVLVFLILLNTQIKERLPEMNLLQIMGAAESVITRILLTQFILLFSISIFFGVFLGLVISWILIGAIFDIKTVFDMVYLMGLAVVLLPVCGLALYFGISPLKKLNPMDLIRQS